MAKKPNRSGLGRGLSSLMGETENEKTGGPAPITDPEPVKPVPAVEVKRDEVPAIKPQPKPVERVVEKPKPQPAPVQKKPVAPKSVEEIKREAKEEAVAEAAVVIERPAKVSKAPATENPKVKPYIEQPDSVTIKEVSSRERKASDEVDISKIEPNPDQPRTHFKQSEIEELAASIEREGLLQPLLVRKVGDSYQIIAGERRWQACKTLGMKKVPVRFKEANDDKALELALIENIQRSNLNPIEEAYGYKRLMERQGMTQSDVAVAVSKGRSTVANALRLLDLPEDAQRLLFEEKITAGHARAILSIPTKAGRQKLTDKLKEEKLTVREAEAIARLIAGKNTGSQSSAQRTPVPDYFKSAAKTLKDALGTKVKVKHSNGKNKVEIEFEDEKDLERMFALLLKDEKGN